MSLSLTTSEKSKSDKQTLVPSFYDLVSVAVSGIAHDEFRFSSRFVGEHSEHLALEMTSDTRHHTISPQRLRGDESIAEILNLALLMIQLGLVQDAAYRFRFLGAFIFASDDRWTGEAGKGW